MSDIIVVEEYKRNPLIPTDAEGKDLYLATELDKLGSALRSLSQSQGNVNQLIAGNNVTIDPVGGTGIVTINAAIPNGAGEANTTSSLGGGESIVLPKDGIDLPFKSLLGGVGITLHSTSQAVTITNDIDPDDFVGIEEIFDGADGAFPVGLVPDPVTERGYVLSDNGTWIEMASGGGGGGCDPDYEEGGSATVYSPDQFIEGGNASTVYSAGQIIDGGDAYG
jgi:hypothetical protein